MGEALEKQRLAGELMHVRIIEKFTFGDFDDALIPEDSTVTDDQGNRGIALSKYVDTPEYAQIIPRYAIRPYHGHGDRNLGFAWLRFEDNEDIYALFDEANYLQKRYASSTK